MATQTQTETYTYDIDLDHAQYWQGRTSREGYERFIGVGDTPYNALEDALEQAAYSGYNVDDIINDAPDGPTLCEQCKAEGWLDDVAGDAEADECPYADECELNYYATLHLADSRNPATA